MKTLKCGFLKENPFQGPTIVNIEWRFFQEQMKGVLLRIFSKDKQTVDLGGF